MTASGEGAQRRRPDASMDLLRTLRNHALDPGYARAGERPGGRRLRPVVVVLVVLLVGLMMGTAIGSTLRSQPAAASDRARIIERIGAAEAEQDALRARIAELSAENEALQLERLGADAGEQERGEQLALATGAAAVVGPGLVLTLDDGPDETVQGSRLLDVDLRHVVNGLWESGAEAVAINGRRLSSRTAIRAAGSAITVNFRSLSRPYVVEAIGDPGTLRTSFPATEGGRWLEGLRQHYGVVVDTRESGELRLAADPGLGVERARVP